MKHYKEQRGQLPLEQVKPIVDKMPIIPSCRRAVIDYYVNGISVKDLNINTSMIIPCLQEVYSKFIYRNLEDYRQRFLYSNDFNPKARTLNNEQRAINSQTLHANTHD